MPAISPPAKVLVTGASGFLAIQVIAALIERGYDVVGTVRSASKGEHVKNVVKRNFEYVVVPDMEADGAYDEAVKGVDAILHTASVVRMTSEPPDAIIKPAVAGTLGILESAKKNGTNVKRVVITSSRTAVGPVLDESRWNDAAVEAVNTKGIDASGVDKYSASKVLAERAAWNWVDAWKDKVPFDVVTICPSWIWGPLLQETSGATFNESTSVILRGIDPATVKSGDDLLNISGFYVDVRDCAAIHADLLLKPEAAYERYLSVTDSWTWQDILDVLNSPPPVVEGLPEGQPGAAKGRNPVVKNSDKLFNLLGKTKEQLYRPFSDTIRDTVASAVEKGWKPTAK